MSVSAETLRDFWEDELAAEAPLWGSGDTPGEAKLLDVRAEYLTSSLSDLGAANARGSDLAPV